LNSFSFECECCGLAAWPARSRQTNDPADHRKQIPLQYAGIGPRYGPSRSLSCTTERERGAIGFEISDQWIALVSAKRRPKQLVVRDAAI
jgi:hypothetical protein